MRVIRNLTLTKFTGFFIFIVILSKIYSLEDWNKNTLVIGGDVRGYYAYLPALFIHNDLKFDNMEVYKMNEPGYYIWTSEAEDGTRYIKYTSGMAMMYSPFFLVAHSMADSLGAEADGFSYPYKVALIIASLFYMLIGIIFLSKFLLRYFSQHVVSIALLILFLGTNLFQYETHHSTYSHGYSFALISVFLYSTASWFDHHKLKWVIWMGISGGLLVLIRPVDLLFLALIPLFGVTSITGLKERFQLFWNYKLHALTFIGFAFLMVLPQLLYFKYISGNFLFYSYSEEAFFFSNPHLYDSLFDFRNGWLLYSPIMVFSIIGLFFIRKRAKDFSSFLWSVPFIYFYVIASWWCWWYVGFGNRAFINLYPLLAIPLCALIAYVQEKKFLVRLVFNSLVIVFIGFNAFQNYQFENHILHWGHMSKDAYIDAWGRTGASQLQNLHLHIPDLQEAKKGRDVVLIPAAKRVSRIFNSFENVVSSDSSYFSNVQRKHPFTGKQSLYFPDQSEYIAHTEFGVPEKATHIYVSYKVRRDDATLAVVQGIENPYYCISGDIKTIGDGWEEMELFAQLPQGKDKLDSMTFFVWNKGLHELYMDDLEIEFLKMEYKTVER